MAEFDGEILDEVFGEGKLLDSLTKISGEAAGQAEAVADEFFKNSEFRETLESKLPSEDFARNENGDIVNGEKNLSEMRKNLTDGNIEKVMKDMGFDTDTKEAKEYIEQQKVEFEQKATEQANKAAKEAVDKGKTIDKPEPTSNDELKKTITNADEIHNELQDAAREGPSKLMEKLKSWKSTLLTILKVLGGIAVLATIILISKDLYDMIKRLQHAMSGCFSCIGDSCCKIAPLTCDDNDLNNTDGSVAVCVPCVDFDCKTGGDWLPIKKSDACSCSPTADGKGAFVGYDYNKTTGYNKCGGTNVNCPIKNTSSIPDGDAACPAYSGCISRSEACGSSGADCSTWCSGDYITLRANQSITCKQMNFWGAAAALLGNSVDNLFPSGLLGKIEKILLYICLGIIIVAVLYMIFRAIFSKITERGEKDKSIDVKINPIITQPTVTASFSRRKK